MHSNDTLVDTPFQLISGFFHVNQGVLCSEHFSYQIETKSHSVLQLDIFSMYLRTYICVGV